MGKKYVPVQRRNLKYKLFLADIKHVYKSNIKKTPTIPSFYKKGVSEEWTAENDLTFEPIVLSQP